MPGKHNREICNLNVTHDIPYCASKKELCKQERIRTGGLSKNV